MFYPDIVIADVASNLVAIFGGVVTLLVGILAYLGNKEGKRDRAQIHQIIGNHDEQKSNTTSSAPLVEQIINLSREIGAVRTECEDCQHEVKSALDKVADLERQLTRAQKRVNELEQQILSTNK